jgi:uncharacterized membrane protein
MITGIVPAARQSAVTIPIKRKVISRFFTVFTPFTDIINTFFASIESKNIDDATRAKLDTAKKLFYTIKNMNRFINFSFMSSMITLLSTIAYNLVFDQLPQNVALVVYPTVGVLVVAGLLTMEKTENKITEFLNIVDSLKQNVRC